MTWKPCIRIFRINFAVAIVCNCSVSVLYPTPLIAQTVETSIALSKVLAQSVKEEEAVEGLTVSSLAISPVAERVEKQSQSLEIAVAKEARSPLLQSVPLAVTPENIANEPPQKIQSKVGKMPAPQELLERSKGQEISQALPLGNSLEAQFPNPVIPTPSPPPELPTPSPLPPPQELLQPSESTPTKPEELPNVPGNITVEGFEVVGSTVFNKEEFDKLLAGFTGRPIAFAELLQARSAVTELYVSKGYITSGALIPPQSLAGGIVKIQVIEGRLESISVTGNRRLNSSYVRSRLAIATQTPLNQNRLLEALQLLQLNPLIQNISAELQGGSRPGLSLLEVRIKEAKTLSSRIFADNARSPSVGSFRRGVEITEANVSGRGDSASLNYANTDGSNSVEFNYVLPVNPRNGTVSLQISRSRSTIVEPPFDELDIESKSRDYELTYRQPIFQTPTREISLGISLGRRESDTTLLGVEYPLSPGSDDRGRTRILAVRAFQEYFQRGSREVLAARSQFSLGVGAFDATVNTSEPDSRFFAWRGQAQYLRLFAPDTVLILRSDVQLAAGELVPLEQIGLGGLDTVRGYRQDLLLSDNGVFASAEFRYPIFRTRDKKGVLQVTPFIDFGRAWNNGSKAIPDPSTLVSAGLGLRWQYGDRFTARFDWGIPLIDDNSSNRTLQERGLYFSIEFKPF
ncbi:MAG TPA: ShlB/FhaC/HecB family hemolysin secretion/activation protein [Kamptonema sp.]|nr:ShlB/FhaC/HecB family hemolysin secretion/activation protein [Kamptonema sp.]